MDVPFYTNRSRPVSQSALDAGNWPLDMNNLNVGIGCADAGLILPGRLLYSVVHSETRGFGLERSFPLVGLVDARPCSYSVLFLTYIQVVRVDNTEA